MEVKTHGTRRSYVAGCSCVQCRAANAAATATHRAGPVGHVEATDVRAHLDQLRRAGLGTRQLAALAHVARSTVRAILAGRVTHLRRSTAAALLGIPPILAHGTIVPGHRTHRALDSLTREGYTRRELAFRLGCRGQQLHLHRHVRVSSTLKVAALYTTLTGSLLTRH